MNARNISGSTPLLLAVTEDHLDTVNALLSLGADVNIADNVSTRRFSGSSPLDLDVAPGPLQATAHR